MTFETMNWESEARRVAVAFGVKSECEFRRACLGSIRECRVFENAEKVRHVPCDDDRVIEVTFTPLIRTFHAVTAFTSNWESVSLNYDGRIIDRMKYSQHALFFARAFFHLDLLTPEVEAAMQVSVSAHEKLEWALEWESKHANV